MAGIDIAPLSKALYNWCFSFTHSHAHSHAKTATSWSGAIGGWVSCSWTPRHFDGDCSVWGLGSVATMAQEVRAVVWQLPVWSHPGRVEVSLGKTPNPWLLLTSWLVPCMAANRRWCVNVNVCVNGWMRGINCTVLWIKALYKYILVVTAAGSVSVCRRTRGMTITVPSVVSGGACCAVTGAPVPFIQDATCPLWRRGCWGEGSFFCFFFKMVLCSGCT